MEKKEPNLIVMTFLSASSPLLDHSRAGSGAGAPVKNASTSTMSS